MLRLGKALKIDQYYNLFWGSLFVGVYGNLKQLYSFLVICLDTKVKLRILKGAQV